MGDYISREAAMMALTGEVQGMDIDMYAAMASRRIRELPPVQQWIPCSQGQPKEDGFYIATLDGEICGEDRPFSGLAEFKNGKWVDDEPDYKCVLAWMPLPEPYKEQEE